MSKAFSYSRLQKYRRCKRAYQYKYVLGEQENTEFTRAKLGKAIHLFAEQYLKHLKNTGYETDYHEAESIARQIEKTILLPSMRNEFAEITEKLTEGLYHFSDIAAGNAEYEVMLAVDKELRPVDFYSEHAAFRGIADVLSVEKAMGIHGSVGFPPVEINIEGEAVIIKIEDWKTGFSKDQTSNLEQLKIYGAMAFLKYADVKYIDNPETHMSVPIFARINRVNLSEFKQEEYSFTAKDAIDVLVAAIEESERIRSQTDFRSKPSRACEHCSYTAFCEDYNNSDARDGGMIRNIRRMNELKSELDFIRNELRQFLKENGPIDIGGAKFGLTKKTWYSYRSDMPDIVSEKSGIDRERLRKIYSEASHASETEMKSACKREGIDYEEVKKHAAIAKESTEMGYIDAK